MKAFVRDMFKKLLYLLIFSFKKNFWRVAYQKISIEISPSINLRKCAKSFELCTYANKFLDHTLKFNLT